MLYDSDEVRLLSRYILEKSGFSEDKSSFVEKDVWLSLILKYLYAKPSARKHLVFKGGTCLVKCYFGHFRFSEDLDFTWVGPVSSKKSNRRQWEKEFIEPLKKDFGFGVEDSVSIRGGVRHSHSGKILNYFLMAPPVGGRGELKLKLTVSFGELVGFPLSQRVVNPVALAGGILADAFSLFGNSASDYFSSFEALCYSEREIACEKMRAILTRKEKLNRSRDIVDLMHLSKVVDLRKSTICPECVSKISRSVSVKAWGDVFEARKSVLDEYLSNTVAYALNESVYVEPLDRKKLQDFTQNVLRPVLVDLISALDSKADK